MKQAKMAGLACLIAVTVLGAGYLWVTASDAGEVLRIDPATLAIRRVHVGGFPTGIVVTCSVERSQQPSANRWHHEVRLRTPSDVDRELRAWLEKAYELAE